MRIERLTEKVMNGVKEETTSAAISYLPGAFTSAKAMVDDLSRIKKKWNITVLEGADGYEVMFEETLKVTVPREYYKDFNENVINVEGVQVVDFTANINEAIKEAQQEVYARFHEALLDDLKGNHYVTSTQVLMNHWLHIFPKSAFVKSDEKVAIRLNDYDNDAKNLTAAVERLYGDDFGTVDGMVVAMEDGAPVGGLEDYEYLVGVKIASVYNGVKLFLEMYVNSAMKATQTIYIDSAEVLSELENYRTVKTLYRKVFPVGQMFAPSIFGNIKDIIDDVI